MWEIVCLLYETRRNCFNNSMLYKHDHHRYNATHVSVYIWKQTRKNIYKFSPAFLSDVQFFSPNTRILRAIAIIILSSAVICCDYPQQNAHCVFSTQLIKLLNQLNFYFYCYCHYYYFSKHTEQVKGVEALTYLTSISTRTTIFYTKTVHLYFFRETIQHEYHVSICLPCSRTRIVRMMKMMP